MRNHVLQVRARKTESGLWWMVRSPRLHGHHCSRVSLTLGNRAPSSGKSSRDGVQLSMYRYLMWVVPGSNLSLQFFLVRLKVFLQESILHQACQLVSLNYASLNVVPKSLVEFAPDLLSRPQIPVSLLREPQLFHDPWHAQQFFVRYSELGSKCQELYGLRLGLASPGWVWCTPRVRSLLGWGFVDPQRLGSAILLRLGLPWIRVVVLHGHNLLRVNMGDNLSSYFDECLCRIPANESLNGPAIIPFSKALTITTSSWV